LFGSSNVAEPSINGLLGAGPPPFPPQSNFNDFAPP
jgi:hypothetical protein